MPSKVAKILFDKLENKRIKDRDKRKELAKKLGVSESALSKRLTDSETPLDDSWVIRIGQYVKMPDKDLQDLLVDGHIEHAGEDQVTRNLWKEIRERMLRPRATISESISPLAVARESLDALDIHIPSAVLEKILKKTLADQPISSLTTEKIVELREAIGKYIQRKSGDVTVPSTGRLFDELWRRINVRCFSPLDFPVLEKSISNLQTLSPQNGLIQSLPILPGLLAYLVTFQPGGSLCGHSHRGLEFVIMLKGSVQVVFDNVTTYELMANQHHLLLYNSEIKHSIRTKEGATILVAHFDSKLISKWNLVLGEFAKKASQKAVADGESTCVVGASESAYGG